MEKVGKKIYFFSDAHIGLNSNEVEIEKQKRILKFLDKLDYVHVFARGQVLKTGDASLADKLESEGYEWVLEQKS